MFLYTLRVGESGQTCNQNLLIEVFMLHQSVHYLQCLSSNESAFEWRVVGGNGKGIMLIMKQKARCCSFPSVDCNSNPSMAQLLCDSTSPSHFLSKINTLSGVSLGCILSLFSSILFQILFVVLSLSVPQLITSFRFRSHLYKLHDVHVGFWPDVGYKVSNNSHRADLIQLAKSLNNFIGV